MPQLRVKNYEDILNILNSIEKNYPVGEWIIQGCHIWPLLRIEINTYLIYRDLLSEAVIKTSKKTFLKAGFLFLKKILNGVKQPYYAYLKDRKHTDKLSVRDALFIGDSYNLVKIIDCYYERFIDPFQTLFAQKDLSWIRLDMFHNYIPSRFSNSIYIQIGLEWAIIRSLLFYKTKPVDCKRIPKFEEFCGYCNDNGIDIPSINPYYLSKRLHKINAIQAYFEGIIDQVKPKLVVLTCYYSDYGMALIQLCQHLDIKVMDIQHGIIGGLHPAYSRWLNVPEGGYNTLPNYFWTWSLSEVKTINSWSYNTHNHEALNGGNLFLDFLANGNCDIANILDQQITKIINSSKKYQQNQKTILVSLQWDTMGDQHLMPLFDAMRETEDNYNWWLRLHPVMLNQREDIRNLFFQKGFKNFELDFPSDFPLYTVLKKIDLHVTHSSSVVIEAAEFGVPSIIFSDYGTQFFGDYFYKGLADEALDGTSLIECIKKRTSKHTKNHLEDNLEDKSVFQLLEKIFKNADSV